MTRVQTWATVLLVLGNVGLGNSGWVDLQAWGKGLRDMEQQKADLVKVHLSLKMKQAKPLPDVVPSWCKKSRAYGAWHMLSDDEYTEESPYLQCAFPDRLSNQVETSTIGKNLHQSCLRLSCCSRCRGLRWSDYAFWTAVLTALSSKSIVSCINFIVCSRIEDLLRWMANSL